MTDTHKAVTAEDVEWLRDTFAALDYSEHHERGIGGYDDTDVVRAHSIITRLALLASINETP